VHRRRKNRGIQEITALKHAQTGRSFHFVFEKTMFYHNHRIDAIRALSNTAFRWSKTLYKDLQLYNRFHFIVISERLFIVRARFSFRDVTNV
jgi:hypothetical protein